MFGNLFKKSSETKECISILQSMQKLNLKDGDIIVFRYPGRLSEKAIEFLTLSLRTTIDRFDFKKVNYMILEEGMEIGILRKEKPVE